MTQTAAGLHQAGGVRGPGGRHRWISQRTGILERRLEANRLRPSAVDCYRFRQANLRLIEAATEHFRIPAERCFNNIGPYGNTAAASVPICLHEALCVGRVKDGDLVMLVAFGTGFSWGSTLLRW